MMDINDLRSMGTVLVALAFAGVCWWAFSPKHKKRFDEAANLPFADEAPRKPTQPLQPETGEERQD